MIKEILFECACGYYGGVVMVKSKETKYKHPVCPQCGEIQEW